MGLKIRAGLISILCFLLVYVVSTYGFQDNNSTQVPQAVGGVLNLSQVQWNTSNIISLDGEWEFFEGQLLDGTGQVLPSNKQIVIVPDKWNHYDLKRNKPESFGCGTYHLTIKLGENTTSRIFGLKIHNIGMSNKVIVDGQVVGGSGVPGVEKQKYRMGNVPYTAYFSVEKKEIQIYVQVANYDYTPYSGMVSSIDFGSGKAIEKSNVRAMLLESIFASSYLLLGIFFFVIFLYRKQINHLFYFALYNFTGMVYILSHGEKLWYQIFQNFNYEFLTKIQYFSAALNVTFYLLFLYTTFPELFQNQATKVLIILSFLLYPGVAFQLSIQSQWTAYQMIFIQIAILYSVYGFMKGILAKHIYALYFALGSLISLFIVNEAIQMVKGKSELEIAVVILQMLWTLLHAGLTSVRVSKAFELSEIRGQELIQMNQYKDEFLAKTSHEFKTPLHGIINIIKLFIEKEKKHLPANEVEDLELAIDIANRLSRLVNDILDVSKVREGKYNLLIQTINLKEHLQNVVAVCQFVYGVKKCLIQMDEIKTDIYIKVDPDRFKQIFYNLIENAMRHNDNGIVYVHIMEQERKIEISVVDQGKGIASADLEEIFKSYVQLDSDQSDKDSRVGLGLSIVKNLVELMEGTIRVESEPEKGASFIVAFEMTFGMPKGIQSEVVKTIPLEYTEKVADSDNSYQVYNAEGTTTILVVDDNAENLKVLVDTLLSDNHCVFATKSGKTALGLIDLNIAMDLVILDVMMPELSGYDVSRRIRERFSVLELPILFLTAAINIIDSDIALQYGANDFLYKPYQVSELRARVKSLVMMKKSASQKSQYEIAFLHAQIKPHFLYNALNTIASYCEDTSPETADLIISLAKYLRGTLDFANISNLISLDKELALVKAYLTIEKARFPKLSVRMDIDEDIYMQLPPLTLQLLVENAVKHGVMQKEDDCEIVISIKRMQAFIRVTVWDNGVGFGKERFEACIASPKEGVGIGLYNLNQRLIKMTGTKLQLFNLDRIGTTIGFEVTERSLE